MTHNADTAREAARRPDGKFGEQHRAEETDIDLVAAGDAAADPCWTCGGGAHGLVGEYPDGHVYRPRSEVLAAMDVEDYDEARTRVEHDWRLLTDGIERLSDPEERRERYAEVAEHFEAVAVMTAATAPVSAVPGYGQSTLNGVTGTVNAAADFAAQARLNGGYGPFTVADIEAGGDALTKRAFDTRDFTTGRGIPMRARIIRKGSFYGMNGRLVATDDMVAFFDARYPDHPPFIGSEFDAERERNGQQIAHYRLDTLTDDTEPRGLNMYGGEPDWTIDAATFDDVRAWMVKRARG